MTEEQERLTDAIELSELIAAGSIDVAPGRAPIPISVWRVRDAYPQYFGGLTPVLAAALVGVYTDPGETVVSVGYDPALAGAAGAGGRIYRAVPDTDGLEHLPRVAGTVSLIVLPWPPRERPDGWSRRELVAMFRACRALMSRDARAMVALDPHPAENYTECVGPLLPAAQRAGLGWLEHVVAIAEPSPEQEPRDADDGAVRVELLVFAVHRSHHG